MLPTKAPSGKKVAMPKYTQKIIPMTNKIFLKIANPFDFCVIITNLVKKEYKTFYM